MKIDTFIEMKEKIKYTGSEKKERGKKGEKRCSNVNADFTTQHLSNPSFLFNEQ